MQTAFAVALASDIEPVSDDDIGSLDPSVIRVSHHRQVSIGVPRKPHALHEERKPVRVLDDVQRLGLLAPCLGYATALGTYRRGPNGAGFGGPGQWRAMLDLFNDAVGPVR